MNFKGKFALLTTLFCFLTICFVKASERNFKPYQWEDYYYPKLPLYAMKNTMSSKKKRFTDLATLLEKITEPLDRQSINDSSSTERNNGNKPKAILETIRRLLEEDLNSINLTNLKNKRLPYGVIFDFEDKNPEEGQSKYYSLLASGHDRKWTLVDEKGNTAEGEVMIDESEIWFRHIEDPSLTEIIEPKTKTVIQNIQGFKAETRLRGGNYDFRHHFGYGCDNLDKVKRAAHFDPKRNNMFIGYFNIETKNTFYDIETTLYTVSWSASASKDVRKDRLKFESDLIYDDFEEGDQVIDSKDTSNLVDVGWIDSIKRAEGKTTNYVVKYKNEAQTWEKEVEEDSLALWSKSKYVNTDAPEKFEILNVKIQMLGQNNYKLPESNPMSRALQIVAEEENKIFDFSKEPAFTREHFTERKNENGILSEIESKKDVPKFFEGLESNVKKTVLQFIVFAFEHYKNFGPEFIQHVETECGLEEPQIEALIQWINRDAFKVLEIVENKISKCSACSSTIKCFQNLQQLIEFEAQYSNGWNCDECGKDSREKDNLFPMHHCTGCREDHCKFCIPKNSFDTQTLNRADEAEPKTNENYCKNQKRKRENSMELEQLQDDKSTEEEKQNRKL